MRSSQPSADERAEYAAAARATLEAERFSLLDSVDDPALGWVELTPDDEIAIRPRSLVRVLNSPVACPLYVRVVAVFSDDTLRVCLPSVPAVTWKLRVDEVAMGLAPESVELDAVG